jgi:hypothetical protein
MVSIDTLTSILISQNPRIPSETQDAASMGMIGGDRLGFKTFRREVREI